MNEAAANDPRFHRLNDRVTSNLATPFLTPSCVVARAPASPPSIFPGRPRHVVKRGGQAVRWRRSPAPRQPLKSGLTSGVIGRLFETPLQR